MAAVGGGGPGARDVQFPIHGGVPALTGVDQVDGNLGVLDPACSSGVLALDTDRAGALLHVAGLVDHQDRTVVMHVLDNVIAHVVADLVRIPLCPPQQVLHADRCLLTDPFGDGPAVLAQQVRQQPQHQVPHAAPGFDAGEPVRDAAHQALERLLPAGGVYAVPCGRVIGCLHTSMISGGRIPVPTERPSKTASRAADREKSAASGHPSLRTPRAMTALRSRAAIEAACSGDSARTPFSVIRVWNCCSG